MIRMSVILAACVLGLAGCGGGSGTQSSPSPLTVVEWKTLPPSEKYSAEVFERLKETDPSLATEKGWDTFAKTVVIPARKKDFPGGKIP